MSANESQRLHASRRPATDGNDAWSGGRAHQRMAPTPSPISVSTTYAGAAHRAFEFLHVLPIYMSQLGACMHVYGVGRTGMTLTALNSVISILAHNSSEDEPQLSVFSTLRQIREQRVGRMCETSN